MGPSSPAARVFSLVPWDAARAGRARPYRGAPRREPGLAAQVPGLRTRGRPSAPQARQSRKKSASRAGSRPVAQEAGQSRRKSASRAGSPPAALEAGQSRRKLVRCAFCRARGLRATRALVAFPARRHCYVRGGVVCRAQTVFSARRHGFPRRRAFRGHGAEKRACARQRSRTRARPLWGGNVPICDSVIEGAGTPLWGGKCAHFRLSPTGGSRGQPCSTLRGAGVFHGRFSRASSRKRRGGRRVRRGRRYTSPGGRFTTSGGRRDRPGSRSTPPGGRCTTSG